MKPALLAMALVSCGGSAVDGKWLVSIYSNETHVCDGELALAGAAGTWWCKGKESIASGPVGVRWDGEWRLGLTMGGVELNGRSNGSLLMVGDGRTIVMIGRRVEMRLGKPLDVPR